jgi:hypothetical protein
VLVGALAVGNTRNYRFWGSASLIDSEGHNPAKQGGTSSQNQVWIGNSAEVLIKDSLFRDTIVFAGTEGSVKFDDVTTYHAAGTRLSGLYLTDINGWSEIDDHFVYPNSTRYDLS